MYIYLYIFRVIVQNERYEEWSSVLRQLRELFNMYQETVVHYHSYAHPGFKMPRAYNSVASQGNVLETLNMSLNCECVRNVQLLVFTEAELGRNYYLDLGEET